MKVRRITSSAMAMVLVGAAPKASAEQVPTPTTTNDDPCATAPAIDEAGMAPFLDRILTPGRSFDLKGIPPETMAKMAATMAAATKQQARDWPNLCRYRRENAAVLASGTRPDAVFLGDSITEFWIRADPSFFDAHVLDRGISGQTTPQILLRFQADVVALHPRVVHILAGTNDIAGNTGPASDDMIVDNLRAMLDLAKANGIAVVLASIIPASADRPERPAARLLALDARLRALAIQRGATYLDYYTKLVDAQGGLDSRLSNDGLHPNRDGFAAMRPLARAAIARALR